MPWSDFASGWEYTANKSVNVRGIENFFDVYVGDYVEPDSDTMRHKSDVNEYFALNIQGMLGGSR